MKQARLTETNLLGESLELDLLAILDSLLGQGFLAIVENSNLLLVSSFSLKKNTKTPLDYHLLKLTKNCLAGRKYFGEHNGPRLSLQAAGLAL